jgi:hypothetical protein
MFLFLKFFGLAVTVPNDSVREKKIPQSKSASFQISNITYHNHYNYALAFCLSSTH